MGLHCSHGAFSGAYSFFDGLRKVICQSTGGVWHDDTPFGFDFAHELPLNVTKLSHPGLHIFLEHSDCDGCISPEDCLLVALDLESLLPEIKRQTMVFGGQTIHGDELVELTKAFIRGCRLAHANHEPLTFS